MRAACLRRVDHVVDLEVLGDVQRLAVLVGAEHHGREGGLALAGVCDGLELAPETEAHRALEAHATELAGRPGDREEGSVEAAPGHRLGAEAIALAEHHAGERNGERCADDEHAADVAHERGLLGLGAHHEPRRVAEGQQRQPEGLAELHEAGGLVGVVGIDGAGQVLGVVGQDSDRTALDARRAR